MKLSSLSPLTLREQRRERSRRDRAAAKTLRVAFPHVRQLRLDLQFDGRGQLTPVAQVHVMYPSARAFFEFACPFADCDGTFDLASPVREAVTGQSQRLEGVLGCVGRRLLDYETTQPCGLQLSYTIAVMD